MDYHSLYNSTEKFRKTLAKWVKGGRCRLKRHFRTKKNRRRAVYIFGGAVIFVLLMSLANAHSQNWALEQNFIDRQIKLHALQGKMKDLQTQKAASQTQLQTKDKQLQDTQKQIDDLNKQLQAKAARNSVIARATAYVAPQTASAASSCVTGYSSGDYYLDKIIGYESGGNSCATNYLGCFGLLQACPGSPLRVACGGDPACQIAWFRANKTGGRSWAEVWQHELAFGWW